MTRRSAWWAGVFGGLAWANLGFAMRLTENHPWWALVVFLIAAVGAWQTIDAWKRAGATDSRDREFVKLTNGSGGAVWIRHDTEPVTVSWGGQSYIVTERSVAMNLRSHPAGGGGSGRRGVE